MHKRVISLIIAAGMIATNAPLVYGAEILNNIEVSNTSVAENHSLEGDKTETGAHIVSKQESINYSDFLKEGGMGWAALDLQLEGAKFITNDLSEIADAITQNYDIKISFGANTQTGKFIITNYENGENIEYIDAWEITVDSSVLDTEEHLTIRVPVINDIGLEVTPKIKASRTSVTREELLEGFDIVLETQNGVTFDTRCYAAEVRKSIQKTSNVGPMRLEVLPYCNAISPTKIKFYIRAINEVDVPANMSEFTFRIEDPAVDTMAPMNVKLTMNSNGQSDAKVEKMHLKDAIFRAVEYTNPLEYSKKSYDSLREKLENAKEIMNSDSYTQEQVDRATRILNRAIENLVREERENQPPVLYMEDLISEVNQPVQIFEGVMAEDEEDGILKNITIKGGEILDIGTPGDYPITYRVTDSHGATTEKQRIIRIVDSNGGSEQAPETPDWSVNEAPTLYGVEDVTIYQGDEFDLLAGVTAYDEQDGDLTQEVSTNKRSIDTSKLGDHVVKYSVADYQANITIETRTITVIERPSIETPDLEAPEYEIPEVPEVEIPKEDTYDKTTIYYGGEIVVYKGEEYQAKWWTQGDAPDKSQAWEKIVKPNDDGSISWYEGMVCVGGDQVVYNGKVYEAKWWTQSTPGSDDSWKLIG